MKSSIKIVVCMFFVIALLTASCISTRVTVNKSAGPESKLIGVWKFAEWVDTDQDLPETANEVVADYYMVFTKKYRFLVGSSDSDRPVLPENPTDSQLLAAWKPVMARIWTYEVKGNAVITRQLFSMDPIEKPGGEAIHPLKFDGDDLTWTYVAKGGQNIITQRFTRIE